MVIEENFLYYIKCLRLSLALANPQNRSEEHTSELQSLTKLVCRLLLEQKKPDHPLCRLLLAKQNQSFLIKVVHTKYRYHT